MTGFRLSVSLITTSVTALLSWQGHAQVSADGQTNDIVGEDIVVTATKRALRLSEVPSAVSVVTDELLKAKSADSLVQYARSVPGLAFTDIGSGRQRLSMRGVDSKIGSPVVGYYIGETPIPGSRGTTPQAVVDPRLYDIERIEVLRGPQGTLYGSGSMGGTVKVVPKRPDLDNFSTELDALGTVTKSSGDGLGIGVNAVVNVPLVEGKLGARLVGWVRSEDGFITRAVNQTPVKEDVPHENTHGLRATLDARLSDDWTVSASVFAQRQRFNGFQDITTGESNPDDKLVQNFRFDIAESNLNRFQLYSFLVEGDLGPANLVSSTSYFNGRSSAREETGETLFAFLGVDAGDPITETGKNKDFSQEIRLISSEPVFGFDYIVGFYYNRNRGRRLNDYTIEGFSDAYFPVEGDNLYSARMRYKSRQYAAFGELSRELFDGFKVTAGLRWFDARTTSNEPQNGLFAGVESATPPQPSDAPVLVGKSKDVIYKFNASYQASGSTLLYATAAQGFRPGLGQAPIPQALCEADLQALGISNTPRQLDSDSLWNYELGAKTELAERRVQLNVAAYQIDWARIQQQIFLPCGYRVYVNGPDVRNRGIEAEVNVRPTGNLGVGGALSYIDSQFQDPLLGLSGTQGKPVPDTPKWAFSAYVDYTVPLANGWEAQLRTDYSHTDGSISNYNNAGVFDIDKGDLDLIDVRIGFARDRFKIALFARNILNDVERTALADSLSANIPYRARYSVNRPRTFGINSTITFGGPS